MRPSSILKVPMMKNVLSCLSNSVPYILAKFQFEVNIVHFGTQLLKVDNFTLRFNSETLLGCYRTKCRVVCKNWERVMAKLVTVFGATGSQGNSVMRVLLQHRYKVRAVNQNPDSEKMTGLLKSSHDVQLFSDFTLTASHSPGTVFDISNRHCTTMVRIVLLLQGVKKRTRPIK